MQNTTDLTKEEQISKEKKRLDRIYKNIAVDKKQTIQGLIERAAFMRISLNEMENDINQNGYTELFSQGEQEPYQRKRPITDLYNSMNTSYQKIIKQLSDLLPKEEVKKSDSDFFGDFVNRRENI